MSRVVVSCRTCLDLHTAEAWPYTMPSVPSVGHLIQSRTIWDRPGKPKFVLQLQVERVTWVFDNHIDDWVAELWMDIPKGRFESPTEFERIYADRTKG